MYTAPKTYERRTVPIPRSLARELGELIAGRGDPNAFVFTSPEGGPLVHSNYYSCHSNYYSRHFKPAVIRYGQTTDQAARSRFGHAAETRPVDGEIADQEIAPHQRLR